MSGRKDATEKIERNVRVSKVFNEVLDQKYRLVEQIDSGGMGKIFKAIQVSLGREVAIKVMHSLDNSEMEQRFFLEASIASQLQSPNTVRIFDYGKTPDGVVYIAMELLKGHSFKKEITAGPVPQMRLICIGKQICKALAEAHENNIVHRDIKPSNIFMLQQNRPFAKLLDFGLVKDLAQSANVSRTGLVLGSPMYMSPEQAESNPVDLRSDIYSLGMTMYHGVTGKPPFKGDIAQVMLAQVMKYPERILPQGGATKEVSPLLEWIIFKAIQKNPAERFTSIAQMYDAFVLCESSIQTGEKFSLSVVHGKLVRSDGGDIQIPQSQTAFTAQEKLSSSPVETLSLQAKSSGKEAFGWSLRVVLLCLLLVVAGVHGGILMYQLQVKSSPEQSTSPPIKEVVIKEKIVKQAAPVEAFSVQLTTKPSGVSAFQMQNDEPANVPFCETPCEKISLQQGEVRQVLLKKNGYHSKRLELRWDNSMTHFTLQKKRKIKKTPPSDDSNQSNNSLIKTPDWAK